MGCWSNTKQPWTWDYTRGAYCRVDEMKIVHWDTDENHSLENGYSTYLCKTDDEMCMQLIQCIADATPLTLHRSLTEISCPEMWAFEPHDIEKVHPSMILCILRKFSIRGMMCVDHTGHQCMVPVTYESWVQNIVPTFREEVSTAILGNINLLLYIKGLIDQCQTNPRILNKNYQQIIN